MATSESLLVAIDMQQGWRHKTATEHVMHNVVKLCQNFAGDVIHCCFRNDTESLFTTQLHWNRFVDSPDIDQIPEIAPLNLPQYWRTTYNCVNDETLPLMRQYKHIYVAGVFTDISVEMTAMSIFDHGIPVSVVRDCVGTLHGDVAHEAALRSLEFSIGAKSLILAGDVPQKN